MAYKKLIVNIELLSEWYSYFTLASILPCVLFPISYTAVAYYILVSGADSYYLFPPTKCVQIYLQFQIMTKVAFALNVFLFLLMERWPFEWKSPMGYLVAWLCESAGITIVITSIVPFFSYLFGSCWLFLFVADDITKDLTAFNIDVITTERAFTTRTLDTLNCAELMNKFCATIRIYTHAKE